MRPGIAAMKSILIDALGHFNDDDGWAMASHLAISALMALFPFLIFATTLAGFIGAERLSGAVIDLVFDTWPDQIAAPIAAEVENVLTAPRGGFLTFSIAAAAFFASNGIEALRTALNRAYRVVETRSLAFRRAQSLVFVLIATISFLAVSLLVVFAPYIAAFSERHMPWLASHLGSTAAWRYSLAAIVIILALIAVHVWLPAGKRRFIEILPGVGITLVAWIAGSILFAYYLERFSLYAKTYAGLASIMIAIVFLYIVSVIFILGGEINAAIALRRRTNTRPDVNQS